MKIAIVAPSPVPYTIGGVENLLWGLQNWMNQNTEHQVELIKLPSRENSFWDLIKTYESFYKLDLSYFDMVISTKYPAWMVRHRNHVCYLQHRLRGLYDTYHLTRLPEKVKGGNRYVDKVMKYMDEIPEPNSLDRFFGLMWELKSHEKEVPTEYFAFPAPFIRRIVHYMDDYALSKRNIRRFLCISETVKARKEYFPANCEVKAIHHPSNLKNYHCGEYEHVFMVSRLDGPKRIDMLIKAMKYVKSDVKVFIAGSGPQEEELKKLAYGDERIHFLGFINDDEVENYYQNSLVIPYFPYDEDYGLITIEAMMHAKPVITTMDAGGPTEFIRNGENGYVTEFNARKIAEKIDYFANNRDEAKRQGENGYQLVQQITWKRVVDNILETGKDEIPKKTDGKKKLTLTSTFEIYPPEGGGQARTYNLYKKLAKDFDIEIVSFCSTDKKGMRLEIAPGLIENRIPKSEKHQMKESSIETKVNLPVTDIAMLTLSGETPEYGMKLKEALQESDLAIVSHPYLYYEVQRNSKGKKFVYEAQDIEYSIKKEMLPDNLCARRLLKQLFEAEKECCEKSEFIMTCSEEDRQRLSELYGISAEKIIVVPNGVDCSRTEFTSVTKRLENKKQLDLAEEKIGLFMGSWHQPNLEACEEIIKIAEKCPDVKFLLMGSQCLYFQKKKLPGNVGLMGVVSEEQKRRAFSVADFALNPMLSGSGTNLKMFDYMSAGLPIITTSFGTRGIDKKDCFIVSEVADMPDQIAKFELNRYESMVEDARSYVEETFDWAVISEGIDKRLKDLLGVSET